MLYVGSDGRVACVNVDLIRRLRAQRVTVVCVVAGSVACGPSQVSSHDDPTTDAATVDSAESFGRHTPCSAPITCPADGLCLQLLAGCTNQSGAGADGAGSAASFDIPGGVAADAAGNVYVSDTLNSTVRRVTPAGVVTTIAGSVGNPGGADGTGSVAQFNQPNGLGIDSAGNVYVADQLNDTIRRITPTGVVTTFAGSTGAAGNADGLPADARFNAPAGVAVDAAGNLYVADFGNFTIREVAPNGTVTTLAGSAGALGFADGAGAAARFEAPSALAVDGAGNVYVADLAAIRKVTPGGVVTTLAGSSYTTHGSADGTGSAAQFDQPTGLALDASGDVYVADSQNAAIRRVTPAGVVTTIAGLDASRHEIVLGTAPRFSLPLGVAISGNALLVADGGFVPPSSAILVLENSIQQPSAQGP